MKRGKLAVDDRIEGVRFYKNYFAEIWDCTNGLWAIFKKKSTYWQFMENKALNPSDYDILTLIENCIFLIKILILFLKFDIIKKIIFDSFIDW